MFSDGKESGNRAGGEGKLGDLRGEERMETDLGMYYMTGETIFSRKIRV